MMNYDTVGAQGYNNKASQLSYGKSKRWLKDIEVEKLTDMKELLCNDVPVLKDETDTQDKNVVGESSRNPIKKRTVSKGSAVYELLLNDNFMNWGLDVVQHTLGGVEMPINDDGTFRSIDLSASAKFSIMSKVSTRPEQEFKIVLYKGSKEYVIYTVGNASFEDVYSDLSTKLANLTGVDSSVVSGTNFISVSVSDSDLFDDIVFSENLCIGSVITDSSTFDSIVQDTILDKTYQPVLIRTATKKVALGVARKSILLTAGVYSLELVTSLDAISLFSNKTADLFVQTLSWINLDKAPIVKFDYMNRRSAGYDAEEKMATGAKVIRLMNAAGSAKIMIPTDDDPSIEVSATGSKLRYVDPMLDDMSDATEKWKEAVRTYGVRPPRALYPSNIAGINPQHAIGITATASSTETDIVTFTVNGKIYKTASLVNPDADDYGQAISDVLNGIDGVTSTYDSATTHSFSFQYKNNSVPLKIANFDFGTHDNSPVAGYVLANAVIQVLQVQFTDATDGSGSVNVYLNGTKFSTDLTLSSTNDQVILALANLINQDEDYYAFVNGTRLTITRVDGREPFSMLIEFEGDSDMTLVLPASGFDSLDNQGYSLAQEFSEDVNNVFMDNIKIGNTSDSVGGGCDMIGFCETANITIDLTRDIQRIDSVCTEDHTIGFGNRDYTLYVDIETTDIDAEKVFDKWDKFEFSKTFPLYFVSVDSGVCMYFPACRFETLEEQERNTNQGHKYRLNVNFDPNKVPVICLPQYLI